MKKLLIIVLLITLGLYAKAQINSVNGYSLPPYGTIRVLLVFAENTNTADYNNYESGWLPGQMPDRADEFFDHEFNGYENMTGFLTKYFYQMSFGNLIMLGDY